MIGIVGVGEVGTAIHALAKKCFKVFTKDIDHDDIQGKNLEVLHICIPYTKDFSDIVLDILKMTKSRLLVINSTVKLGTCRNIYNAWKDQSGITDVCVAHTPIMGVHPRLVEHQHVFKKAIGAIGPQAFARAKSHWLKLGSPEVIRFESPETTELAKLLSTTYYGWNILFNKLAKSLADESGLDFEQVYTKFNHIYNHGYAQSHPEVTRPVLRHMPGPIGGHCVTSNIRILNDTFNSDIFAWMLELDRHFAHSETSKILDSMTVAHTTQAEAT